MVYCAHTEIDPAGTCGTIGDVAERLAVAPRNPLRAVDLVGENLQLLDQYRRLDGVEPEASPMRTLSYLSLPCPCTRRLRRISASSSSSVITAPPSP